MKKKTGIVIASIVSVIAITTGCLVVFLPVTYNYDKSLIKQNPDYSVVKLDNQKYTTLSNGKEDFKIIGFTDTHFDTYAKKSKISLEMIIRNVVNEKPDLVVFDGDIITSSFNKRRAKQFTNVMDKLGVYWAPVLGNHEGDNFMSVSRTKLLEIYSHSKYCLVETNTKTLKDGTKVDGDGNYVINILNKDNKISQSLYFIDSGAYMSQSDLSKYKDEIIDTKGDNYDYIKEWQIKWYKETVNDIKNINGETNKSLMFVHIPLPEFKTSYELITGESEVTNNTPTYNVEDGYGDVIYSGARRETICFSGHNSGMFNTIKELGSTQAVISGHDHLNNFVLKYEGVKLGYCQSSGYSAYNVVSRGLDNTFLKGYSIFNISSNGELSWENNRNADKWPELQEEILKLYK